MELWSAVFLCVLTPVRYSFARRVSFGVSLHWQITISISRVYNLAWYKVLRCGISSCKDKLISFVCPRERTHALGFWKSGHYFNQTVCKLFLVTAWPTTIPHAIQQDSLQCSAKNEPLAVREKHLLYLHCTCTVPLLNQLTKRLANHWTINLCRQNGRVLHWPKCNWVSTKTKL